jgi:hypothetical protein
MGGGNNLAYLLKIMATNCLSNVFAVVTPNVRRDILSDYTAYALRVRRTLVRIRLWLRFR